MATNTGSPALEGAADRQHVVGAVSSLRSCTYAATSPSPTDAALGMWGSTLSVAAANDIRAARPLRMAANEHAAIQRLTPAQRARIRKVPAFGNDPQIWRDVQTSRAARATGGPSGLLRVPT